MALAGLGAIAVALLVLSRTVEPWLQRRLVAAAADNAQSELQLADLDVAWWPLGVQLQQVELRLAGEEEPYLAAESASALVGVGELLRGRVKVDRVVVETPRLVLRVRDDGSLALPSFGDNGGGGGARRFELGSLELRDGELVWRDGRIPLQATLTGLRGESVTEPGGVSRATIRANSLDVIARGQEIDFAVEGEVAWEGSRVELTRFRGIDEQLRFEVSGVWQAGEGSFDLSADGDLSVVEPWLAGEEPPATPSGLGLSGRTVVEARITNTDPRAPGAWMVGGSGRIEDLHVDPVRLTSVPFEFELLEGRVEVASDEVRAYGGLWRPRLEVTDGSGRLRVEGGGLSLARLAADLGWPSLAAGGVAGGSLDYRFEIDDWSLGSGEARVDVAAGGAWTLAGAIPVEIAPGLGLALDGQLADGVSTVELGGRVDADDRRATLDFRVRTDEVVHLLTQLGITGEWLPTAGRGEIAGNLNLRPGGRTPTVTLTADLEQANLASLAADRAIVDLRLDAAGAAVRRADLTRLADDQGGQATLSATIEVPSDRRPVTIDALAQQWPLVQLLPLAGLDVPAGGLASGAVQLSIGPTQGARTPVQGSADLTLAQPAWEETALSGEIRAQVAISDDRIRVTDGRWRAPGGELEFAFATESDGAWHGEVTGHDLVLADWHADLEAVPASYRVSLEVNLRGREWIESADARIVTGFVDHPERQTLSATLTGSELQASGGVAGVLDQVTLQGSVTADGPDLAARSTVYPGSWVELPETPIEGSAQVVVTASGSWEQPEVLLEASQLEIQIAGQLLRELEPIRVLWRGNEIELESAYVEMPGTGGEFFVAGSANLDSQILEGVVQAEIGAVWLESLVPELTSSGNVAFLGGIEGTFDEPIVDGQGEWSNGTLRVEGFPHTLTDLRLRFLLGSGRVVVDRASADLAGGRIDATGSIDPEAENGPSYSVRLAARGVNVNLPEDWWIGGDATLRVEGDARSRLISGDLDLERAVLLESIDLSMEQLLRAAFERQREWVPSEDEVLRSTRLQLQVTGNDALRVSGEGLDLTGDIDLSIGGDLASPLILGRVDLASGGALTFRGNEFEIERGVLTFSNPHVINPEIELVAASRVRSYDVRLHLRGTLESMDVEFTSDPSLPSLEVVSLLTTGQVGTQPLLLEPISTESSAAAEALLAGQAAEALGSRVGKLFGLDRVQVDPLTESSGSLSSARITVAKRLSGNTVATYSYDPTDAEQQVVQIDWQLSPAVTAVITQHGDGSYSVDLKWQRSF